MGLPLRFLIRRATTFGVPSFPGDGGGAGAAGLIAGLTRSSRRNATYFCMHWLTAHLSHGVSSIVFLGVIVWALRESHLHRSQRQSDANAILARQRRTIAEFAGQQSASAGSRTPAYGNIGRGGAFARNAVIVGSMSAAAIHVVVIPEHFAEDTLIGTFFVLAAASQAGFAVMVARKTPRSVLLICAGCNLSIVLTWVLSRVAGVPAGPEPWQAEPVAALDLGATMAEGIVVAGCLYLARRRVRSAFKGTSALTVTDCASRPEGV